MAAKTSREAFEFVKAFRDDRLAKLDAGEMPAPLADFPRTVLHVAPAGSFDAGVFFDLSDLSGRLSEIRPSSDQEWASSYNFDGFLIRETSDSDSSASYVQVFRNGIVEMVDTLLLASESGDPVIDAPRFERELLQSLRRFLDLQRSLGAEPPVFVLLSLIRVKDYSLGLPHGEDAEEGAHPLDRDELVIPECVVDSFDADAPSILKPAFDVLWNSAGFPSSKNFDRQGKWKGPRL
jgi:hypothetical protein